MFIYNIYYLSSSNHVSFHLSSLSSYLTNWSIVSGKPHDPPLAGVLQPPIPLYNNLPVGFFVASALTSFPELSDQEKQLHGSNLAIPCSALAGDLPLGFQFCGRNGPTFTIRCYLFIHMICFQSTEDQHILGQ